MTLSALKQKDNPEYLYIYIYMHVYDDGLTHFTLEKVGAKVRPKSFKVPSNHLGKLEDYFYSTYS